MLEQCAGRLIGQDPTAIERCWQDMYRAFFYPPGREKMHALGALDLALWDIRGKMLNRPIHALLGEMDRNFCELYNTAGVIPRGSRRMSIKEQAQATCRRRADNISMESSPRGFLTDQPNPPALRAADLWTAGCLFAARTRIVRRRSMPLFSACAEAKDSCMHLRSGLAPCC